MYLHKIYLGSKTSQGKCDDDLDVYSMHQKIWRIAKTNERQKRDFLYRIEYDAFENIEFVYLLAPYKIESNKNNKVVVSPKFVPQLKTGEYLYFKLRANPIVRKKENDRAKECDIIMDAKHQFKRKGQHYLDKFSMDELIHKVGIKWLTKKGDHHGFSIEALEVKIDNYRSFLVNAAGKQNYTLRTLDFEGKLRIADRESFIDTLFKGIGRSKAFGCGLMLVKRA